MVSPQQQAAPALTLLSSPLGKKRTLRRNGQVLGHMRVKGLAETQFIFKIDAQKWRVWPVGSDTVLWDLVFDAEVARLAFTPANGNGWPTRRLVVNEPAWRPQFDMSLRWETPPAPGPDTRSLRELLSLKRDDTWALVDAWDRTWLSFHVTGVNTQVHITQPLSPWPAPDPEWGLVVAVAACAGHLVSSSVLSAQSALQSSGSDSAWIYT